MDHTSITRASFVKKGDGAIKSMVQERVWCKKGYATIPACAEGNATTNDPTDALLRGVSR